MSTLTLRLPDEKHDRLRQLARHQNISLNKLFDEFATIALAEFDAFTRFRARAAAGSREEGLRLLDKLAPKKMATLAFARATALEAAGRWADAEALLRPELSTPRAPLAALRLNRLLARRKAHGEAVKLLRQTLKAAHETEGT